MTEEQRIEHNRLFEEAATIIRKEIILQERSKMPLPSWWLRRKLYRAIRLLDRVLAIHPDNYSASWLMGKAHQRLCNHLQSFQCFERTYQINPSHPDVAREASLAAMELGEGDAALVYSYRALQLKPTDCGLQANLALAYLISGRVSDAKKTMEAVLSLVPDDKISRIVSEIIHHFVITGRTPPRTVPQLRLYWKKQSKISGEETT